MISEPLDERFLQPEGWVSGLFSCQKTGHAIHYGHVMAQDPKGIVILLGGLSEFSEKYYETAHDFLKRGLSVYTMDWFGQGASERYLSNREKRHSDGFDRDCEDLHAFISQIVKPQNQQGLPTLFCAHSMGAHIGLHYALIHPAAFDAIALSAPMGDIYPLKYLPHWLRSILLFTLRPFYKSYVFGGGNWDEDTRNAKKNNLLSSDPIRREIHEFWSEKNTKLRVGSPTFGWVNAAVKSCESLKNADFSKFTVPTFIALAGDEKLVDNAAIRHRFKNAKYTTIIEISDSKHEILMERGSVRDQFWQGLDKMLEDTAIFA